ncbi:MCE family protein [Nocardia sp. alder85J]|uniref:MCE family protein n=1 Tax=Nocardia sp. alder85J TaxID=2862949 RepID=UPI001CD6B50F|nr:MCE family protein [Nocardia sp. alder85J]MCX4098217.1 MCE family protein [Nocardia sp. alder85J]
MRLRTTTFSLVAAAALLGASGCAMTVNSVPMPKPGLGRPGYTLHAAFGDALNLPDHAHVKIGGTDIGIVTGIHTTNFLADVQMLIRDDIRLPKGTTVELRQATPLGDIFVAMTLPAAAVAVEPMRDGDTIGTDHTAAGASVEQLMMSVSLLLNGGGINQAARITTEMNSMFAGRAPELAHLLTEMTGAITALNQRTGDLDAVLNGLNTLSGDLAQRKSELGAAADTFPALIGLLTENNQQMVQLLTKVATTTDALGDFATTTGGDFVGLFHSIQVLMSAFAQSDQLTGALDGLHALYPSMMASLRGPALAVAATVSYLSIGALTDPSGSRPPEIGDVGQFAGSLAQVFEKVFGRLNSPPRPPGDAPGPGAPQPQSPSGGDR